MNKFNQSDELQQFYNDIQEWIDNGCQPDECFSRDMAICDTLAYTISDFNTFCFVKNELRLQFMNSGLDSMFPFGGSVDYEKRYFENTMYKCPKRLKWIKDHSNI